MKMIEYLLRLTKRINFVAYNQMQTSFELFQNPIKRTDTSSGLAPLMCPFFMKKPFFY